MNKNVKGAIAGAVALILIGGGSTLEFKLQRKVLNARSAKSTFLTAI